MGNKHDISLQVDKFGRVVPFVDVAGVPTQVMKDAGGGIPVVGTIGVPAGLALETTQQELKTLLQAIDVNTDDIEVKLDAGNISIGNVDVNTDEVENLLAAIKDADGIKKITDDVNVNLQDGSGVDITSTAGALDVNLKSPIVVEVGLSKDNDSVVNWANTAKNGTGMALIPVVDADGNLQVDVLASALPAGAATEASLITLGTEATLATLATEATLDGKDFATSAKQDAIIGHVDTLEALLTSVKDTDGVKKIVDDVTAWLKDGSGNVLTSTVGALDVNISSGTMNVGIGGAPEHHNGVAGTSPSTVTFSGTTKTIIVQNLSIADTLQISFDGGTTWTTILKAGILGDSWEAGTMKVQRGGTVDVDYQIVATV